MFMDRGIGTLAREYGGGNLNSLTGYCIVKGAAMVNAPDAEWWYVENLAHAAGVWQYQKATALNRVLTGFRERWLVNGVWTAWGKVGGSGGDIVGKKYSCEMITIVKPAVTGYVPVKSFTYAKGGMVKIGFPYSGGFIRLYVDGVLVIDYIQLTILTIAAKDNYMSNDNEKAVGDYLTIPFENSFSLDVNMYSTETSSKACTLHYYLNT